MSSPKNLTAEPAQFPSRLSPDPDAYARQLLSAPLQLTSFWARALKRLSFLSGRCRFVSVTASEMAFLDHLLCEMALTDHLRWSHNPQELPLL